MVVDAGYLIAAMAVSAASVAIRPTWRVVRYAVTAVHEFGHLVVALAVGGHGARVRLRVDTSGLTTWRTATTGRGRTALIALAGPATPPLVGAGSAWAFSSGRATLGVSLLAVLVGALSLVVRNVWGLVVCFGLGGIIWAAWRYGTSTAEMLMVVTATVLCLGGVRAVAEEMASLHPVGASDTKVAVAALWLPARVWEAVLMVWAVAWTCAAAWLVVRAL